LPDLGLIPVNRIANVGRKTVRRELRVDFALALQAALRRAPAMQSAQPPQAARVDQFPSATSMPRAECRKDFISAPDCPNQCVRDPASAVSLHFPDASGLSASLTEHFGRRDVQKP
jgi:hypothetical protein